MEQILEPLKKTRLSEEITEQLVSHIKAGTLKPGDKLPTERELAEKLGVSRTAIREALRSMESMGYITSKVGGGTYIKAVTLDNITGPLSVLLSQNEYLFSDLADVRLLLEGEIASLAAKNASPEQITEVRNCLKEMKKDIDNGGNGLEGDNNFHGLLAKIADNSALLLIINMCSALLSQSREATLEIPGLPQNALEDHYAILNAVEAHSPIVASSLMKQHLKKTRRNFEKTTKINKKDRK